MMKGIHPVSSSLSGLNDEGNKYIPLVLPLNGLNDEGNSIVYAFDPEDIGIMLFLVVNDHIFSKAPCYHL
jgi:hypothetical protein